jgi:hypothetical protein
VCGCVRNFASPVEASAVNENNVKLGLAQSVPYYSKMPYTISSPGMYGLMRECNHKADLCYPIIL